MDWIKVKVNHAEYEFLTAPDNVFRAWIMAMMFVAAIEKIPKKEQIEARIGKDNYIALEEHLSRNALSIRYIMEKVMEDVEAVKYKRNKGKERQSKYREVHAQNNAVSNALVTGADKIREDKRREDKSMVSKPHPTLEEISNYNSERGNLIKSESFFNYYSANGWRVGRNPMKDWRAAFRHWESKEPKTNKPEVYKSKKTEKGDPMPNNIKEMINQIGKRI